MLNHDVTDLSKTVYADLVKEAAGKVRQVLGLHAEEEIYLGDVRHCGQPGGCKRRRSGTL